MTVSELWWRIAWAWSWSYRPQHLRLFWEMLVLSPAAAAGSEIRTPFWPPPLEKHASGLEEFLLSWLCVCVCVCVRERERERERERVSFKRIHWCKWVHAPTHARTSTLEVKKRGSEKNRVGERAREWERTREREGVRENERESESEI